MKRLELSDRSEVERITSRFPPYSDFNFVSMWLWNLQDRTRLSVFNGNLIVRLSDIRTQQPFFTFLGDRKCDETAAAIIDDLLERGLSPELAVVPKTAACLLSGSRFEIVEDRDNHDYIASAHELSTLAGAKFAQLRAMVRRFERGGCDFRQLDISNGNTRLYMRRCADLWMSSRSGIEDDLSNRCLQAEQQAFDRLLSLPECLHDSVVSWGSFVDGEMAGFLVGGVVQDHWIFHFGKASHRNKGTFHHLHHRTAQELLRRGVLFHNLEEDLGLPRLRFAKLRYRPLHFLKKYTVRLKGERS